MTLGDDMVRVPESHSDSKGPCAVQPLTQLASSTLRKNFSTKHSGTFRLFEIVAGGLATSAVEDLADYEELAALYPEDSGTGCKLVGLKKS